MDMDIKYCFAWIWMDFFITKYIATHEQVTRSAPSLETNDTKIPYVNTKKINVSMSRHY